MATRTCVVPDLDDELTHALTQVEELLLLIAGWEEDAASEGEPWTLPAPLTGRVALDAVRRLWDVLAPTQSRTADQRHGDVPARRGGRWLAADGRYELAPLAFVDVDQADVEVLGAAAHELGRPDRDSDLTEAIETAASGGTYLGGAYRQPSPADLVALVARIHGLLDLPTTADPAAAADVAELVAGAAIAVVGDGDLILTAAQEAAYHRTVDRLNAMWASSDPLARYQYGVPGHW